ncbi:hypothetical protein CEUSTIGMA_g5712.t1 [Chlamydomonas eustigma]|uniref:Cap-specific mRNA (nucleoside-2'-O-)-methyltransferase 2 n=1 Tax=Chlamydomonas eustigma TaxID=1157962 RepID=A0A250X671_9CHLO|nr:hypothetical protein CEUSTIGMA_g5712.t1 [Chlamydomonas eustigma]|eukprot:GAX78270.1 hypothetical protein CEUSTIGMA_g5712.t1 [Chlamydomonas eustigma]
MPPNHGERGRDSATKNEYVGVYSGQLVRSELQKAKEMFEDRCIILDIKECRFPQLSQWMTAPAWSDPNLQAAKEKLNGIKSRLDNMPNGEWLKAASLANRAEFVKSKLRNDFNVELGTVAWAKMYEAIMSCSLLPHDSIALGQGPEGNPAAFTVHLCEAPGAFIAATNHFVRTHRPTWWWDWLAISLNPYYEGNDQFAMIDDDKLIGETLDRWCWGADDSGDLRKLHNMEAFWRAAHMRHGNMGAMLVTADGAVDTSMDPNRQEEITAGLHLCEIVAAVGLLALGGHFMWKGFTLFEHASLGSLYLMACLFEEVAVYKPATSKPANSEVYVVGRGFKGVSQEIMAALKTLVSDKEDVFDGRTLFPQDHLEASGGFMESVRTAAISFAQWQGEAIIEALDRHASSNHALLDALRQAKRKFAEEWMAELKVLHLDREWFLAPAVDLDGSNNNTGNVVSRKRGLVGTLEERKAQYRKRRNVLLGISTTEANNGSVSSIVSQGSQPSGSGAEIPPPSSSASGFVGSEKARRMMESMGYKEGQGLGAQSQGMSSALEAEGGRGKRAGLGFGDSSQKEASVGAVWTPVPDTRWLTNDRLLGSVAAESSLEELLADPVKMQATPHLITKSKAVPDDDVLTALRTITSEATAWVNKQRQEGTGSAAGGPMTAAAASPKMGNTVSSSSEPAAPNMPSHVHDLVGSPGHQRHPCLCSHTEPCLAPRSDPKDSRLGRGYFKFGALDSALGIVDEARLAETPRPLLLDLSLKGCSATQYVLESTAENSSSSTSCMSAVLLDTKAAGEWCIKQGLESQKFELHTWTPSTGADNKHDLFRGIPKSVRHASDRLDTKALVAVKADPDLFKAEEPDNQQQSLLDVKPDSESRVKEEAASQDDVDDDCCDERSTSEVALELCTLENSALLAEYLRGFGSASLVIGDMSSLGNLLSYMESGAAGKGHDKKKVAGMEMELNVAYRRQLLWSATTALKCLAPGGCLVLRLGHTLTAFSATLVYLLYRCFSKMWMGTAFSTCAASCERHLVLCGRLRDMTGDPGCGGATGIGAAVQLLDRTLVAACEMEVAGGDGRVLPDALSVSELLPQPMVLSDKTYYSYFASHTSALAERQVEVVKKLLTRHGGQEQEMVDVSEDQRDSHRRRALHHIKEMSSQDRLIGASFQVATSAGELGVALTASNAANQPLPPNNQHLLHREHQQQGFISAHYEATEGSGRSLNHSAALPSPHANAWLQQRQPPGRTRLVAAAAGIGERLHGQPLISSAADYSQPSTKAVAGTVRDEGVFPLKTMHPTKGMEFVCNLKLTEWPVAKLQGLGELLVYVFEPREKYQRTILHKIHIKAKPVSSEDCKGLEGFVNHLAGIRNPNSDISSSSSSRGREKVAVVRWGPIEFFLTLRDPQDPLPSHGLFLHV